MANVNGSRLVHGHGRKGARTPEYRVWMGMRDRCRNPNTPAFHAYGARGIDVCDRWDSFEVFLSDMGSRPSNVHSLDRIDNEKGYSPENCRWATCKEQQRNRRSNVFYEVNGVIASLAEHCEAAGVKYKTAHRRITQGASIEMALSTVRPKYGSIMNRKSLNETLRMVLS